MANHSISLTDAADPAVRDAIVGPLLAYNTEKTGRNDFRLLILTLHDADGTTVGGRGAHGVRLVVRGTARRPRIDAGAGDWH